MPDLFINKPQSFSDYAEKRWGKHWAICRNTPKNRQRYSQCITNKEYTKVHRDWLREVAALNAGCGRQPDREIIFEILSAGLDAELLGWRHVGPA